VELGKSEGMFPSLTKSYISQKNVICLEQRREEKEMKKAFVLLGVVLVMVAVGFAMWWLVWPWLIANFQSSYARIAETAPMVFLWLALTAVSLALLSGSGLALLHVLSQTNRYGTRVETGGFKFLVKGESLYKVLDNLPEREGFVDQVTHTVGSRGSRRNISWLEQWLGIVWISIWWPLKQVHMFEVVADKMRPDDEIASGQVPVRRQIKTDTRRTDYLRFRFPHPVLVTSVELGKDRWKVDFIIMLDVIVTNPATVVFGYKGRVLRQVDAAVSSAAIDFWNSKKFDYGKFVAEDKGPNSKFAKAILALNQSTTPNPESDGLEDRFGIKIMAAWVAVADLSPEQKALDEAATSIDMERNLADAAEQKARGIVALGKAKFEGPGQGLKTLVKNLKEVDLSSEQAATIALEQVRMSNVADSKLTTYVEGGGNVQPTIPVTKP